MFLRCTGRFKDGKAHRYWNIVENKRTTGGRIVQRQVLYLGEINDSQQEAWRKTIEVFEYGQAHPRQMAIFPEDRPLPKGECNAVQVKLNEIEIKRPRQWGACWLFCVLWDQLQLDRFWQDKLLPGRKGTRWLNVFKTLTAYRLIDPGRAYSLIEINVPATKEPAGDKSFTFSLRKDKLRAVRSKEGRYLIRSNMATTDPALLWKQYMLLTEIEQAFKELKGELSIRPIHHQKDERIEAHIFIAFQAYCLNVTLKHRLKALAPGLTQRSVVEQFKKIQMVDVLLPTTDGRHLKLSRYTQPEKEQNILLNRLKLYLPPQPPPQITSKAGVVDQ